MGELLVKRLQKGEDKLGYLSQLLDDIDAFEELLANKAFTTDPICIGAEQEVCLTDTSWRPSPNAVELLERLNDPHFTYELARYNMEINLDPFPLEGDCFSRMHKHLDGLLHKAKTVADTMDMKCLLTGILPTISTRHMDISYMTPVPRYFALNDAVRDIRKDDIELHIKGVDEINLHHDSVLYEGCNTSFQGHLQINPDDFQDDYNWAQAIAGPMLAVSTNSPLLMGRELWAETRIALFAQSVDTRASTFYMDEREPQVGFGNEWEKGTAADYYKESVVRFRSFLAGISDEISTEILKSGRTPKLKALGLHNGTVYKWNRLCYGQNNGRPHLRIENRYMPSGPSTTDEIANLMFWVGVMKGRPAAFDAIHTKMDFRDVKSNFFNAARYGMNAQFFWDNQVFSSKDLILDHLLPMAYKGLYQMKIKPEDVEKYLTVIENRVRTINGSRWQVLGYRKLRETNSRPDALRILTAAIYRRQQKGYAVDAWRLPDRDELVFLPSGRVVGDLMETRIITAQTDDSVALLFNIMQWKEIHHIPILDENSELAGLLSWNDIKHFIDEGQSLQRCASEVMETNLITVSEDTSLAKARKLMEANNIHSLPVVTDKKLLGIITSNDL